MSLGGGSQPAQDTYAQNMMATISREQYADYKKTFVPVENDLMAGVNDANVGEVANQAEKVVGEQIQVSEGIYNRNSTRYGISTGSDISTQKSKERDLDSTLAKVGAKNFTRGIVVDQNVDTNQSIVRLGRDTAANASKGFGISAGMEANRNNANRSIASSNRAGNAQTAGTAVGLGIAAYALGLI